MKKLAVYTLAKKKRASDSLLPLSIFESSRRPHRKKPKPFIYKKDHDDADQLIKIPSTKSHTKSSNSVALLAFDKLDKLLSSESANTTPTRKQESFSSLPSDILQGNFYHLNSDKVKEKYKNTKFPLPNSKTMLKNRTLEHIDIIPRILAGEEELSFYYTLALEQRKMLNHSTMTLEERWDIKWEKYIGGFYGLQRQLFISTLLQNKYSELLSKSLNKTVKYWTPDMFSTYVLANEIILKLVMEDMGLLKPDAEKLMKDTVDYGCKVADDIDFHDDLEFEEII